MTADNTLRVLQRVASVFSRNRINIEQLNVFATNVKGISHLNIAVYSEEHLVEKISKQLGKVIELHEIHVRRAVSMEAA